MLPPKHSKYNRDVDPTVIRIAHGTAEIRISEMKNEFVRTVIKRCRIGDHEFDPYLILVILSDWASIPCHNAFAAECDAGRFVLFLLWPIEFVYEKSCISLFVQHIYH